jgi:dihydroflavonol-4-reductase
LNKWRSEYEDNNGKKAIIEETFEDIDVKIAVTGATGFVGQNLCRFLERYGHSLYAIARDKEKGKVFSDTIRLAYGDVTKLETLNSAFSGMQAVIHLAALFNHPEASWEDYISVNVEGTRNVMKAAVQNGVKQVIHCSTVGVAFRSGSLPFSEDTPYSPLQWDKYETSKCEGEKLALNYHGKKKLNVTVLRPAQVYGPGDRSKAKFYRMVKKGILINPGNTLKHPIFIEDLCRAFELALNRRDLGGNVFIIGNQNAISLKELITIVADNLGAKKPNIYLPAAPITLIFTIVEKSCRILGVKPPVFRRSMDFFTKSVSFDVSKAQKELGFKSEMELALGVSETADWYIQEGLI